MILSVLIINDLQVDLSIVKGYFEGNFCKVIETTTIDEALRIVGRKHLDLVMLILSDSKEVNLDFLSLLRTSLGVTPLIGVADLCKIEDIPKFSDHGVDDIIYSNISKQDLFRTIKALSWAKEKMCVSCLVNNNLGMQSNRKIVILTHHKYIWFDMECFRDTTVINFYQQGENWGDCYQGDVLLVDIHIPNIVKVCADIRLNRALYHKPMLLVFSKEDKDKAESLYNQNIGVIDIINKDTHPYLVGCKINAHIKYKRLLDEFYREVKRNIFMSTMDPLTTVYNRGFLEDYINKRENALHNAAVLMIDLDKFKEINDKYGHAFADKVLSEVVTYIKSYIRLTDFIARYGGDEFLVFMRNISRKEVESVAHRLVEGVKGRIFNGIKCSVSIGICYIATESVKLRKAIYVADSFMYIAKKAGGNAFYLC